MKKSVIVLGVFGALLGIALAFWRAPKGDPLDKLFPADSLKGALVGARVSVFINASSQTLSGGKAIVAQAVLPADITAAKLIPTAYGLLKRLLQENREASEIRVFIAEDSLLARAYEWVGLAIYRRGQVTVMGGLPTQVQIDSAKSSGGRLIRPSIEERQFMAALFDQTSGLAAERLQVTLALRGEGGPLGGSMNNLLELPLETAVLGQVGKAYNMKAQEAREKALAIHHFYWLNVKRVLVSW